MPDGGLMTHNRSTGQLVKFIEPWAFESVAKADEIFIFCVSNTYTEVLIKEFSAAVCIEIWDRSAFFDRLRPALPPQAKFFRGDVKYYEKSGGPKADWALPERIAKSKLENFAYQDEYRFAFSVTDALNFGSTRQRLIGREFRPRINPAEHHAQFLYLGDLRDICRMHECGTAASRSPALLRNDPSTREFSE